MHVIALDLPGFGQSPPTFVAGAKGDSLKDYADAIKAFLEERGINKAVFGGCSWGGMKIDDKRGLISFVGYIIFEIWRRYPSIVAGMLLCDTRMEADTPETIEKRKHQIDTLNVNGGSVHFLAETMVCYILVVQGLSSA